ncbi:DUF4962 domain-containing protein [Proteiniphilum sp. X52]|uniref:DUF4962 domain-containing protein n=1 Tax=Proteiniphilum sp. X52 TaxID=2382159 RepID=UPI000F09F204|nr:DUF4962 domain-containing protein [Proteiniphilum sp. X52]RNC66416.1 DUF4962 domain-containing protein [Proteiniphilum sp. X52]
MRLFHLLILFLLVASPLSSQECILKIKKETMMHEVRATPSPLPGEHVQLNPPRFRWPDKHPHWGPALDGVENTELKPEVTYRIRISKDAAFQSNVITGERNWAFFNPVEPLEEGKWYWQHAFVDGDGAEEWSPVLVFYVDKSSPAFNPPSFEKILQRLPSHHPRILLDKEEWDNIIERNKNNPETQSYFETADKCLKKPLKSLDKEIDTAQLANLSNEVQYKAVLIRESRKIVDREEKNMESLIRAFLLTKDHKYYAESMKRLSEVIGWQHSQYFAGDFNLSTILSLCTSAYDAFYNILTLHEKNLLLNEIKTLGGIFFHEYVNHLENRIADNHVWQMTFRILTMAAFATVGELPEATQWADYCYNLWVSRFPGLNNDGGWHNGDSYFHVNIRTLIEVPAFYTRVTGFDFFSDPWYNKNADYVVYNQPPFSKSAGQGNAHENVKTPSGARVGYADALARECRNPWVAAYVNQIKKSAPGILTSAFESKPADLTWYRCTTTKEFPADNRTLTEIPLNKVFPATGLAIMHTSIAMPEANAMLSFRSSPYGSTSHALANQNSFNTFYGGKPIFYSSGHRTGFSDPHSMYSYRNTRAHNTILVDGMGQKIGTEGYGWIPRYYEGNAISYVAGDASNAYGEVTSALWLKRAGLSEIEFTPQNGWDKNRLTFFRRHIIQLGKSGVYVIFDELEAMEPVNWSFLLHTVEKPMQVNHSKEYVTVTGTNKSGGKSVAHIFCSQRMKTSVTDKFFQEPENWKNVTDKSGKTVKYPDHWHFTAETPKSEKAGFLAIIDTHGPEREDFNMIVDANNIKIAGWNIECNLTNTGGSFISIKNDKTGESLFYDRNSNRGVTDIVDTVKGQKIKVSLCDVIPDLEI